jgi:putative DNA primase/helicase
MIRREQQRRELKKQKSYDAAAHRAVEFLRSTQLAQSYQPNLVRKQIKPHDTRAGTWRRTIKNQLGERVDIAIEIALIIPMFNKEGKIRSLQAIFPEKHPIHDREKDFLPGGQLSGLFWWVGPKTETILVCEGFAIAASLYEEAGNRVYMALRANNLMTVCRYIREQLPENEIIVCADNDANTSGNPGVFKATEAAEAIGARVAVPPITGDFNDFITSLGAVNDGI